MHFLLLVVVVVVVAPDVIVKTGELSYVEALQKIR